MSSSSLLSHPNRLRAAARPAAAPGIVGFAAASMLLLAGAGVRAQTVTDAAVADDASAPPTTYIPGVIRLTPPAPDGGIYGSPSTTPTNTPPPPSSGTTVGASPNTAPPTTTAPPVTITTTTTTTASPEGTPPTAATSAPALPPPPPGAAPAGGITAASALPAPGGLALTEPLAVRPRRPSLVSQRLRILNMTLPPMAERSRNGRILDGVLSLVIGGAMGGLSFAFPASPGADFRPYLWTVAGLEIASGVLTLAWVPARETLTSQFERMPMATARQRRERLRFGEHALNEMAADGARRRVLGAIGSAAVPLGMLLLVYKDPIFNGTPYTFSAPDYLVLGFTAVEVVVSLVQLFTRSEEERLRESYWRQVQMLRAEQ